MTTPILEDRATILEARFDATLPMLATKEDVTRLEARFNAILPTLATKEDVARLEARFDATVPTLATKEDLVRLEGKMDAMGNRLLLQFIGIAAGLAAAAFAIARFL